MQIISRAEAKERGLKRYFTNVPCSRGHISERYVHGYDCCECRLLWDQEHKRKRDPSKTRPAKIRWAKKNPEKIKEKGRRLYRQNRDRLLTRSKLWQKRNREASRAIVRKRRALRVGTAGIVTAAEIREIVSMQRNRCARCGCKLEGFTPHADHIIALSKGGQHHRRNIQMLCPKCNCEKHAADPIDDARRLGRLL